MKLRSIFASVIPTLAFNIKAFGLADAVKMKFPVLVGGGMTLSKIARHTVFFEGPVKTGMVHINMGGVADMPYNHSYIRIDDGAKVTFVGKTRIGKGCDFLIGKNSDVRFGNNFSAGNNFFISSNAGVHFGDNVLLGWNVSVRDSDGHSIIVDGCQKTSAKKIIVEDHVWIGSDATLLKGTEVRKDSVVASHAVLTKPYPESHVVIGGIPGTVIKTNINWEN